MFAATAIIAVLCLGAVFCQSGEERCPWDRCINGGTCHLIDEAPGWRCECEEGYTGPQCEEREPVYLGDGTIAQPARPPPCHSDPCGPNGQCIPIHNGYLCRCDGTMVGPRCNIPICQPNRCQNGASCRGVFYPPWYRCICLPGFYGYDCEHVDPCYNTNPCLNGGECKDISNGEYECECPEGFIGRHCETDLPCVPDPCTPPHICVETDDGGHFCDCPPGTVLPDCREENPCDPNPCHNGGECFEGPGGSYTCRCVGDYYGLHCEDHPCIPNPCYNGGTCIAENQEYTCECDDQHWYGPHCDIPIDCDDCLYDNGRGYLENEIYCYMYIMCVAYPGGYMVFHMECAPGTSWSQAQLTCVEDKFCNSGKLPPEVTTGAPRPCNFSPYPENPSKYIWHFLGMDYIQDCAPGTKYNHAQCTCVSDERADTLGQKICLILDALVTSSFNFPVGKPNWATVYNPGPDPAEATLFNGAYYYKIDFFNNWMDEYSGNQIRGVYLYLKMTDSTIEYQGVLSNADCDYQSSIQLVIRYGWLSGGIDTTSGPMIETPGIELTEGVWHRVRFEYNRAISEIKLSVDNTVVVESPVLGFIENRHCAITLGRIVDDNGAHYFTGEMENVAFYKC